MSKPVIQLRAIKYHLDQHPELKLHLGLVHEIWFMDKTTKDIEKLSVTHIVNLYNLRNKEDEKRIKAMRKELKNGHGTRRKPEPVRPTRRVTQTTITGDDDDGGPDTADDRSG